MDNTVFLPTHTEFNGSIENGTNDNITSYVYLYEDLKDYFLKWYLPSVITLGFAGSAFCFLFLARSHMFPKNMRIWLICICIGDFLILSMEGLWMLLKVWYKFDIRDQNDILCIIHTSLSNYLFYWSAYVQSLLSVQRCYLVLKPLGVKAKFLSVKNLLICLCCVSAILILPILPYAIYWRVIKGDCDPKNDNIFRLTTVFDLVFWGLIPVILMSTSTLIIWRNLLQRRNMFGVLGQLRINASVATNIKSPNLTCRKRHSVAVCRMQIDKDQTKRSKSLAKFSITSFPNNQMRTHSMTMFSNSHNKCCSSKCRVSSDGNQNVTFVLICMNFVYITSVYPLIIYFICLNFVFHSLDKNIHRFIYYLFRSLCFLNACTNWIFYCVAGGTFRKRTIRLVRRICSRLCPCNHYHRSVTPLAPLVLNTKIPASSQSLNCLHLNEKLDSNTVNGNNANARNNFAAQSVMMNRNMSYISEKQLTRVIVEPEQSIRFT